MLENLKPDVRILNAEEIRRLQTRDARIQSYQMVDRDDPYETTDALESPKLQVKTKQMMIQEHNRFTDVERFLIIQRADFKCEICGDEYDLQADHVTMVSVDPTQGHDWANNGRCLCRTCHAERHPGLRELVMKTPTSMRKTREVLRDQGFPC
jgi:hypothetical protein